MVVARARDLTDMHFH